MKTRNWKLANWSLAYPAGAACSILVAETYDAYSIYIAVTHAFHTVSVISTPPEGEPLEAHRCFDSTEEAWDFVRSCFDKVPAKEFTAMGCVTRGGHTIMCYRGGPTTVDGFDAPGFRTGPVERRLTRAAIAVG